MFTRTYLIAGGIAVGVIILSIATVLLLKPEAGSWEAVQSSVYPQFTRIDHKNLAPIVTQSFSKDLDIAYVIDRKKSYDFITKEQMRGWAVSDAQIHMVAMDNLEERAADTQIEVAEAEKVEHGKYITIETGDGYDAIRLLSQVTRDKVAQELGDTYIAAVPLRDFLIFWAVDFPLQDQFISQVQSEFENAGTYRLTPNVFKVTPETIEPLIVRPAE